MPDHCVAARYHVTVAVSIAVLAAFPHLVFARGGFMNESDSKNVPYELTVVGYDPGDSLVEAEIGSPLLDPLLHPEGTVRVKFVADVTVKPGVRFTLHSFQVDSVVEYLRSQALVRQVLEAELPRDRANWRNGKKRAADDDTADVLKLVKFDHLASHPREAPAEAMLARMKSLMSPEQFEAFLAAQDTPQTRTTFSVVLKCPWDREHNVVVHFRDGAFRALAHE